MSSHPERGQHDRRDVARTPGGDGRDRHRAAELDRHRGAQRQPGDGLVEGDVHPRRGQPERGRPQRAAAPRQAAAGGRRHASSTAAAPSRRSTATAAGASTVEQPDRQRGAHVHRHRADHEEHRGAAPIRGERSPLTAERNRLANQS